jgi:hypothetical protein
MPALMQLQGPNLGNLGWMERTNVTPPLSGAGGSILLSPIVILLIGGVVGGVLAQKNVHPFRALRSKAASIRGHQRMQQSRTKALSGRRRR